MTAPSEKLARSLNALHLLQERGVIAIRAADLPRTHRERLVRHGFLQPVMKGWYVTVSPDRSTGDGTAWYASFRSFCAAYLRSRFGARWCLSPEQSLALHAGNRTVPSQLLVRAPKGRNRITALLHGTSPRVDAVHAEVARDAIGSPPCSTGRPCSKFAPHCPMPRTSWSWTGCAHSACPPRWLRARPGTSHRIRSMRGRRSPSCPMPSTCCADSSTADTAVAGRLAAAFRGIGRERIANEIVETMRTAGFTVRECDPFEAPTPALSFRRDLSPLVQRIRLMWDAMRGPVLDRFPVPPGRRNDVNAVLEGIEEVYVTDAWHSLSIEGYRVSPALIERVRGGAWNPDRNEQDRAHRDALAARGYWQAYQAVRDSVRRMVEGENPGTVAEEDHRIWYRETFAPSVAAGLARPADLAGYRDTPVYIQRSMHAAEPARGARRDAGVLRPSAR